MGTTIIGMSNGKAAVFNPDGTHAAEGVDFAKWSGEYHKNGKWSYTEGGIASKKELFVFVNVRSTHSNADNRKIVFHLNEPGGAESRKLTTGLGSLSTIPIRPKNPFPEDWLPSVVWEAWLNNHIPEDVVSRWQLASQFI